MALVSSVKPGDWVGVRKEIQRLSKKLGQDATPVFTDITVTDLTASRLVATDSGKVLESVPGTSIHPEFKGVTVKNDSGNVIFYANNDEMYFTAESAIEIASGMPIGLSLIFTYNV